MAKTPTQPPVRVPGRSDDPDRVWGQVFPALDAAIDKGGHVHATGILTGVEAGIATLQAGRDAWVLAAGIVAYIPPEQLHSVRMMPGYQGWIVSIPAAYQPQLPDTICALQASALLTAAARRVAGYTAAEALSPEQTRVVAVVVDELRLAQQGQFLRIPMPSHPNLRRVAQAVIDQPDDMAGIDGWAARAAMSRRSFTRRFAAETGSSFGAWRQAVKTHAALRLLSEGRSVTAVAFDLGYQNVSAFIDMFRRTLGELPGDYRRGRDEPG